jgi:uncharacterized protein YggE
VKRAIVALLVCLAIPAVSSAQEKAQIRVQGEAVVRVAPDKVTVVFGIETWDKDIMAAKEQNNAVLSKARDAIAKAGVARKDVQTAHLSVHPRYKTGDYTNEGLIGYFVRNSLSVTLKDPAKVEGLITSALAAGVTHIHGVNFETTEYKKYREQARRMALEAAREKAQKMAAVLDREAGAPISIAEGYYHSPRYGGWWGQMRGGGMSQNVMQNVGGGGDDGSDTLALGKISIRASVTVVFALK